MMPASTLAHVFKHEPVLPTGSSCHISDNLGVSKINKKIRKTESNRTAMSVASVTSSLHGSQVLFCVLSWNTTILAPKPGMSSLGLFLFGFWPSCTFSGLAPRYPRDILTLSCQIKRKPLSQSAGYPSFLLPEKMISPGDWQ